MSNEIFQNFFFLMPTLIGLLQLMYEGMNASPFETHYTTMVLFFVSLFVYFIAAIAEKESPQPQNPNDTGITSKTKFFSGCFALNMLLLILIPPFGWFTLASCIAYFVKVIYKSLFDLLKQLLFHEVIQVILTWGSGMYGHNHPGSNGEDNNRPPVELVEVGYEM